MNTTLSPQASSTERTSALSKFSLIPSNFNPAICPIIATHWLGLRPTGTITATGCQSPFVPIKTAQP